MRIVQIIPDNRDEFRRFHKSEPCFGPAPAALLEGFAGRPDCEVHVVSCTHRPMKAPTRLAPNIFFHLLTVPALGWKRGLFLGCTLAIRRKLAEIRPDLVHGQGTERYCALAAAFSGFPSVLTIHGNMRQVARQIRSRPFSDSWVMARLEAFTLPRSLGVCCNSDYTEQQARPIAQRVWRVPNALRLAFFSPRRPAELGQPPLLLNIGQILPYKRQLELLKLAGHLHERGQRFVLEFLGNAPNSAYASLFRSRVREAERLGYARYRGFGKKEEIIARLDQASALIHVPSEEAFGLVAAEALARNLKLFASRCGGLVDIASGVDGAELFEVEDWPGLQTALEVWIRRGCPRPPEASSAMTARYHPTVIASRHCEIYQELIRTLDR